VAGRTRGWFRSKETAHRAVATAFATYGFPVSNASGFLISTLSLTF
jgi:hypothetical protein